MVRSNTVSRGPIRHENTILPNWSTYSGNIYIKMLLSAAKIYNNSEVRGPIAAPIAAPNGPARRGEANNWKPKKSKFLHCVVSKQFYVDRQLKTFTGKIISGNRNKCRVYWNDGHITTVQLKTELRNGTIEIITGKKF
jgi:hypothetical protein